MGMNPRTTSIVMFSLDKVLKYGGSGDALKKENGTNDDMFNDS